MIQDVKTQKVPGLHAPETCMRDGRQPLPPKPLAEVGEACGLLDRATGKGMNVRATGRSC